MFVERYYWCVGFSWRHPGWWWSWLMLGVTVAANMAPSWAVKEQSLARHQGWAKYTRTTGESVLFTSTHRHFFDRIDIALAICC